MWGQGYTKRKRRAVQRIIPTRVGTRMRVRYALTASWDHPHACGDKRIQTITAPEQLGSSPRVWGQEFWDALHEWSRRIIPTRVGTSSSAMYS